MPNEKYSGKLPFMRFSEAASQRKRIGILNSKQTYDGGFNLCTLAPNPWWT